MLSIYFFSILFTGSLAQVTIYGSCPDVMEMTGFDANQYAGLWYEIERYDNVHENDMKCTRANYSTGDNGCFKIDFRAVLTSSGALVHWEGNATPVGNRSIPRFNLEYPQYSEFRGGELFVIHTDYKSYAIEYMCQNVEEVSELYLWIFSRSNDLDTVTRNNAYQQLREHHVPSAPLNDVQQNNCPPP